ncbi:MAG: hypothetical protein GX364_02635 [Firmicutes bacterium]|jgi:hypothetical protein|nr:hypothetical protein [Bacillota bacterium]
MKSLVESVRKALESENWHGALFIAITLPDICGKIDKENMTSRKRYVNWFDKYLRDTYVKRVGSEKEEFVFLSGDDLYALRCAMLHEGSTIIDGQSARDVLNNFEFSWNSSHLNFLSKNYYSGKNRLVLNVGKFCEEICSGVEKWMDTTNYFEATNLVIRTAPFTVDGITFGGN